MLGMVARLQLPVVAFCFSETHAKLLEDRMVRRTLQHMEDPKHAFYTSEYAALREGKTTPPPIQDHEDEGQMDKEDSYAHDGTDGAGRGAPDGKDSKDTTGKRTRRGGCGGAVDKKARKGDDKDKCDEDDSDEGSGESE